MQKLSGEVFKEYCSGYLFSNFGRVYSLKNKKFLKPYPNSHGYMRVGIYKNGCKKDLFIHITVVHLFGDCNGNFPECEELSKLGLSIDHLNRNKADNSVSNLEIISLQENCSRWPKVERAEDCLPY